MVPPRDGAKLAAAVGAMIGATSPPMGMIPVTGAAAAKVGRHKAGHQVAAGVSYLRLATPGGDETRKVVVVR
jgi:hypothetical protein